MSKRLSEIFAPIMNNKAAMVAVLLCGLIAFAGIMLVIDRSAESKDKPTIENSTEDMEADSVEEDENDVETIVFKWEDDKELFSVTMDKSLVTDEFTMTFSETERYIEFSDNPEGYGSTNHVFTYFPTENPMTAYFKPETETDYALTYPVPDVAQTHNESYIYYNTSDDGVTNGRFYDWEVQKSVKGYPASHIVSYTNYLPENMDTPFFTENSARGNSYCVFDLMQLDDSFSTPGYLVVFGMASAGSEIDFCETLDELEVFEIEVL